MTTTSPISPNSLGKSNSSFHLSPSTHPNIPAVRTIMTTMTWSLTNSA
ncbi:hypothetical protein [Rubritalea tangerina]